MLLGTSAGEGGFVPCTHVRVGVHELSGPRGSVLAFGLAWRVRKQSRFLDIRYIILEQNKIALR